ncbi:hypothetical protein [uncultured Sphingomonas sp.]|uniref:hypothetical protein n=1 Tax=uncultured Sphingomonas sp. TaxID=158754 RepID=UPI0025F7FC21|nr:hypothetical protein [uncultured Sphingomonas sp.]
MLQSVYATIVMVFGIAGFGVIAIAEATVARRAEQRRHFWAAGAAALLALTCIFYLVKG